MLFAYRINPLRKAGNPAPFLASLLSAVFLAGCASSPPAPTPLETLDENLPLVLRHPGEVTELLDATTVGSEIVAVGDSGVIIHSSDSGQTWQKSATPVPATLTGVSFAADGRHGWAVGHDALILASSDSGETWQKQWQGENQKVWLLDVLALDERRAIAVGTDGFYVATSDGGATWSPRRVIDQDSHLNRLSRGPTGTLYLAGEHGTALRSRDEGVTWVRLPSPCSESLYGILPLGSHALLAYGGTMAGNIYRSDDDGQTWSALFLTRKILLKTGLVTADGSILLAGDSGDWRPDPFNGYFISHDGGHLFVPWKLAPPRVHDWSKQTVIELLQAQNGTFIIFGPSGATILGEHRR